MERKRKDGGRGRGKEDDLGRERREEERWRKRKMINKLQEEIESDDKVG